MVPPPTRKAEYGPAHRLPRHLARRHVGGSALPVLARAPGAPARTPPPERASGRTDTHSHDANADPQGTPARPRQHRPGNRTGQDAAPTATHSPRHTPRRRRRGHRIARRAQVRPVRLHRGMQREPTRAARPPPHRIRAHRRPPLRHAPRTHPQPIRRRRMMSTPRRRLLRLQRQHPHVRTPRDTSRPRHKLAHHATAFQPITLPNSSCSGAKSGSTSPVL